jgi:hypothetical protein
MTPDDDRPRVGRVRIAVWIILGVVGLALFVVGLVSVLATGG